MVIDRIEGSVAVVELAKGEFFDVPVDRIGGRVRDGAVLMRDGGGYAVDEAATAERAAKVAERRRKLFKH